MTHKLTTLDLDTLVTVTGGMTRAQAERAAARLNNPPKQWSICWKGDLLDPTYVACPAR